MISVSFGATNSAYLGWCGRDRDLCVIAYPILHPMLYPIFYHSLLILIQSNDMCPASIEALLGAQFAVSILNSPLRSFARGERTDPELQENANFKNIINSSDAPSLAKSQTLKQPWEGLGQK